MSMMDIQKATRAFKIGPKGKTESDIESEEEKKTKWPNGRKYKPSMLPF